MDAVRVELEAMAWRDGLKAIDSRKNDIAPPTPGLLHAERRKRDSF
jgi:hypothetical protein